MPLFPWTMRHSALPDQIQFPGQIVFTPRSRFLGRLGRKFVSGRVWLMNDGAEDESVGERSVVRPLLEERDGGRRACGHERERPRIPFPFPSFLPSPFTILWLRTHEGES